MHGLFVLAIWDNFLHSLQARTAIDSIVALLQTLMTKFAVLFIAFLLAFYHYMLLVNWVADFGANMAAIHSISTWLHTTTLWRTFEVIGYCRID